MAKYKAVVECRNAGGTDIHCWIVNASSQGEAGYVATEIARAYYPEFDEFEPIRTEEIK